MEPFLGTGTFLSRLLSSGIIKPEQLEHKYKHEIFGNEIVLLSYYIASINIESTYQQVRVEQGHAGEYTEFEGIALTDTFQLNEADDDIAGLGFDFAENIERLKRQREARIKVIVMNPPYSSGQTSANDNNQNLKYPRLDRRIEKTYVERSTGTNKNSLYDSYFRALRWATDRIGDAGIIAFVSNNSFLDGNTADGVRLTFQDEFSDIYIYNLKGNQRTQGDRSRREGGKIFDSGSRTGIAITVLVKTANHEGPARIHYAEVDDYLTRQEKLDQITDNHSITGTTFRPVTPNAHGDWISVRDETFTTFQPIGDKTTKGRPDTPGVFQLYSRGLATSRDAWCYNFSEVAVAENMARMIDNYNAAVEERVTSKTVSTNSTRVSWNRALLKNLDQERIHGFDASALRTSMYRPFTRETAYFSREMNDMIYQLPQLFPTPAQRNLAIGIKQPASPLPFGAVMAEILPDLSLQGASSGCQVFSLYTWAKLPEDGSDAPSLFDAATPSTKDSENADFGNLRFDFTRPIADQVPTWVGGYERRDNITDATLNAYRERYGLEGSPTGERIAKEDIFFYVYALLHHPDYRERYEADLKKMLPRIPMVPDFWEFSNIGRELADLHVNYEDIEPYPITENWALDAPTDDWKRYRVEKLGWGKTGKEKDTTRLVYNDYLTLTEIPTGINNYQIGGRSPLEWMIDRYKITQDKKSGIINDPNDYFREVGNPRYLADLIKSLVTVTMRTQELVRALPEFIVDGTELSKS